MLHLVLPLWHSCRLRCCWEQRALLIVGEDVETGVQYARHAVAIERHPFTLTTLGQVLLRRSERGGVERKPLFDEAFDFYDGRKASLGTDFIARVQEVFDRIAMNPQQYPVALTDIRKAVVKRFPYCVYYRAGPTRVEIIAIFHTARDPAIWRGRA